MKNTKPSFLFFLLAALFVMLVNLGSHHIFVHTDEPRRTLVALELLFSGNWFYPTINGEAYLNKPAVFNWMIIALYKIFGSYDEWVSRLTTVIFSLLCSLGIYKFLRDKYDESTAVFVSLAFIINGRFLFYDSFLGMMDLPFAFFSLGAFYFLFYNDKEASYGDMFLSYSFAAMAFLLKGIPGLYFQFINVLVYFIKQKNIRHFGIKKHLLAASSGLAIICSYYVAFFESSSVDPVVYFENLFNESSKRTVSRFGIWATVKHLLYFPLDSIGNFLPWTLGLFAFFSKNLRRRIFVVRMNRLLFILMLLQLIPYWTSPEVSARYLYCILPFTLLFSYEGFSWLASFNTSVAWKNYTLVPLSALLLVFCFLAQFFVLAPTITNTAWIYFSFVVILGFILLSYIPRSNLSYGYLLMCVLIFARLSYDLHLLPKRAVEHIPLKKDAYAVAELTKEVLYVFIRGLGFRMAVASTLQKFAKKS